MLVLTNGSINYGKAIIKNLLTPEERKKCLFNL